MDIAVIGAGGAVGRAVAAQILATNLLTQDERLQLVGRRGGASETGVFGLRIDLLDAYAARAPRVEPVLDDDAIEADVIIMCAGATPSRNAATATDRASVAAANLPMFEQYAAVLERRTRGHEIVVVQSNPVELCVDVFSRRLGRHRVVGAGAYNDTMRFRREVAGGLVELGYRPTIGGFVLGEHGPHMVPVWSSLTAHGVPAGVWEHYLRDVRGDHVLRSLSDDVRAAMGDLRTIVTTGHGEAAFSFVQSLPPDVRAIVKPYFAHWAGGTATVTAHAAVELVAGMRAGLRQMLPLQVSLTADEWPRIDGVLGVTVDIDSTGWHRTAPIPLTDEESLALRSSAEAINDQLRTWYAAR